MRDIELVGVLRKEISGPLPRSPGLDPDQLPWCAEKPWSIPPGGHDQGVYSPSPLSAKFPARPYVYRKIHGQSLHCVMQRCLRHTGEKPDVHRYVVSLSHLSLLCRDRLLLGHGILLVLLLVAQSLSFDHRPFERCACLSTACTPTAGREVTDLWAGESRDGAHI